MVLNFIKTHLPDDAWLVNRDGLWDIFFGLGILGLAFDLLSNGLNWFITIWVIAYFIVLLSGKDLITRPRCKCFKIQSDKKEKLVHFLLVGIILITIGIIMGFAAVSLLRNSNMSWAIWLAQYIWLISAFYITIAFVILAYYEVSGPQFYAYAIMTFFAAITHQMLLMSPIPYMILIGGAMIIIGLTLFIRFLIKYPVKG